MARSISSEYASPTFFAYHSACSYLYVICISKKLHSVTCKLVSEKCVYTKFLAFKQDSLWGYLEFLSFSKFQEQKFLLLHDVDPSHIASATCTAGELINFLKWQVRNSYRMSARGAWIGTTSARGNVNSKRRQPRGVYIPRAEVIPIHAPRARIR